MTLYTPPTLSYHAKEEPIFTTLQPSCKDNILPQPLYTLCMRHAHLGSFGVETDKVAILHGSSLPSQKVSDHHLLSDANGSSTSLR